jgi:hypothetical protein
MILWRRKIIIAYYYYGWAHVEYLEYWSLYCHLCLSSSAWYSHFTHHHQQNQKEKYAGWSLLFLSHIIFAIIEQHRCSITLNMAQMFELNCNFQIAQLRVLWHHTLLLMCWFTQPQVHSNYQSFGSSYVECNCHSHMSCCFWSIDDAPTCDIHLL